MFPDLSKEEKVPYEQQALAAKNNYKQQIKRFEKDETLIIDDRTTKSKKTKLTSDDEDESDEFENIEEEEWEKWYRKHIIDLWKLEF